MKKLLILLSLALMACDSPVDLINEDDIQDNFVPIVSINQESQTIGNGASITLSVDIDDQDDFYHYYVWTVDGQIVSDEEDYTFSRTPSVDTDYIVGVSVTDGKGLATDSIIITVLDPPWQPEPLHIYFFPIGEELEETGWARVYVADNNTHYQQLLGTIGTTLEVYNRDNDPDCYIVYGGLE